jgi:hypothetical protein
MIRHRICEFTSLAKFTVRETPQRSWSNPLIFVLVLIQNYKISRGQRLNETHKLIEKLKKIKWEVAEYQISKSDALHGDINKAIKRILKISDHGRLFKEAAFSLGQLTNISITQGDLKGIKKSKVWDVLLYRAETQGCVKTLLSLSFLVDTNDDLMKFICAYENVTLRFNLKPWKKMAALYSVCKAAERLGCDKNTIKMWTGLSAELSKLPKLKVRKAAMCRGFSNNAKDALLDLDKAFKNDKIMYFLMSGTLLGMIRAGEILSHDKDLDLGVMSDISSSQITEAIFKTGKFWVININKPYCIRLRHVNGVPVDIFWHTEQNGYFLHGSNSIIWSNKVFGLKAQEFWGQTFSIPDDYDQYLIENYGNWKVENKNFDILYDCPNAQQVSHEKAIIHNHNKLFLASQRGDLRKYEYYASKIYEFERFQSNEVLGGVN